MLQENDACDMEEEKINQELEEVRRNNPDGLESLWIAAEEQGVGVHEAPGQEWHLPHEAWHVAEQMAGRVDPGIEVGQFIVHDDSVHRD